MTKVNKTASYTYDMSGVRSGKTVNGVSYEYTTLSGKITRMTWSGNAVDIVYDDAGRPYILRYTPSGGATQTYYYVLNLQGDVVGLMNTSMQMVVKYSYDPWGKLTGTTATSAYVALAQANPLRYRSYCYDIETGFYYLQTRYYDPTIARFINADSYLTTDITGFISSNMFAYCENNPVIYSDPTGKFLSSFCVNMTDEGLGLTEDEKILAELRKYGFDIPLNATLASIEVTVSKYEYGESDRRKENLFGQVSSTILGGAAGALSTEVTGAIVTTHPVAAAVVGIAVSVATFIYGLNNSSSSASLPDGEYDLYNIKVTYYERNPLTNDMLFHSEENNCLMVYSATGSGESWFKYIRP